MLEVLCQHAKFGGAQTSHATKGAKNVKFFVCLLVVHQALEYIAGLSGGDPRESRVRGPPLS